MNAINLNLIQAAALPQQAEPGVLNAAPLDGLRFSLWLNQSAPDGSGGSEALASDSACQSQTMLAALPASVVSLLHKLDPQLAAAGTETQQQSSAGTDVLNAIMRAVCDAIRDVLDAGSAQSAAAQPSADQTLPAGDSAELGSSPAKLAAAAEAALKQAAVMWLQEDAGAVKQAGVTWLQANGGVSKQASGLQLLLEHWPQLAEQLQTILGTRSGLDLQVSPATAQAWPLASAPVPWSTSVTTAAVPSGISAEVQAWLNQGGASQLLAQAAAGAGEAAQMSGTALDGLGNAPASIRWFAVGGSEAQLAAQTAAAAQSMQQALPAAMTELALADGTALRLAIIPHAPAQPAAATGGSTGAPAKTSSVPLVPAASNFTVALYNPAEELPLLTAQLTVQHVAEPQALLPTASWQPVGGHLNQALADALAAANAPGQAYSPSGPTSTAALLQQDLSALQSSTDPAITVAATPAFQPLQISTARDNQFRLGAPVAATQPVPAEVMAALAQPVAVRSAREVLRQTEHISVQIADAAAAQLKAPAIAPPTPRHTAHLAAPETDYASAKLAAAGPRTAAALNLEPQPTAVTAATASFTALSASRSATRTADGEATPTASASSVGGLVFGQLPAQLMQFSGREFNIRPYAGLEFRELAGKLLAQTAAARSQGDGLYRMTLDLNPPSLGRMSVSIAVRGDNVALQLAVASTAPREQLKGNLAALQQSLEEAGLNVVELKVVTVDPDGQPAKQYREPQTQPQPETAADDEALSLAFSQALGASNA